MTTDAFHLMDYSGPLPDALNDPLDYEPHPLCVAAKEVVCNYLKEHTEWAKEVAEGKMFGVLVCRDGCGRLGFLAAYSGQIGGREDWPWFVPAVFDYLQPDGYFKLEEQNISELNHQLEALLASDDYQRALQQVATLRHAGSKAIDSYKQTIALAKAKRDEQRQAAAVDAETEAAMVRESQFQKAELRRLKARCKADIAAAEALLKPFDDEAAQLRQERKQRSDALQRWLFDHFAMVNAHGERRTLTDIFRPTPQQTPPSGSGECCAPKLFQYAFLHHLEPLQIAEFWQGRSPRMEIRYHDQYYTACRGKCKPILEWILKPQQPQPQQSHPQKPHPQPLSKGRGEYTVSRQINAEQIMETELFTPLSPWRGVGGEAFLVFSKPSGLLSVSGRTGEPSVESLLTEKYGRVWMVHRLDQDTSGLMVVALTGEAYHKLQQQFLARVIYKRYIALVEGVPQRQSGTIRLPLRPDHLDRPRQLVDPAHGKEAVTDYEVLQSFVQPPSATLQQPNTQPSSAQLQQTNTQPPSGLPSPTPLPPVFSHVPLVAGNTYSLVSLVPHTGRTHQLRVHCAHVDGLGCPIVGDRLYGHVTARGQRLCLHAAELRFRHPVSDEWLQFSTD